MRNYIKDNAEYKINLYICAIFALYVYSFTLLKWTYLGYFVTYCIPIIYIMLNHQIILSFFKKISLRYLLMIYIFFLLLFIAIMLPSLYGTNDYSYVKTLTYIIRKGVIFSFLITLICKNYSRQNRIDAFMSYYAIATSMYVCGTILFVLFPKIKNYWFQFVLAESQKNMFNSFGYTFRVGWMGFSGFQATLKCTISVIFTIYLLTAKYGKNRNARKRIILLVCLGMSLLGNAFYARVGLLCSGLVILVFLLASGIVSFKKWLVGFFLLAFMFIILLVLKDKYLIVNEWYVWMTTPFKNLIHSGNFNNASVNELTKKMIFMPKSKTFWLGDAKYSTSFGGYYMETDVGFMRQLLFWGIFGTFLCYSMLFLSIPKICRDNKWLLLSLVLVFIVFEIKGEAYYDFVPVFIALNMLYKYSGD